MYEREPLSTSYNTGDPVNVTLIVSKVSQLLISVGQVSGEAPYTHTVARNDGVDNLVVLYALYPYGHKLVIVTQTIKSVVQQHVGALAQSAGVNHGKCAVGIVVHSYVAVSCEM